MVPLFHFLGEGFPSNSAQKKGADSFLPLETHWAFERFARKRKYLESP